MCKILLILCTFASLLALSASNGLLCFIFPSPAFAKSNRPTLLIVSPKQGDQILGDTITFSFIVANFNFSSQKDLEKNNPYVGHLHLYLDQKYQSTENERKIYSHDELILKNLKPGKHTLTAEVVQNNHSSFSPKIISTVSFTTFLPQSTPTPTPVPFYFHILGKITIQQLLSVCGILLLIIGFILYLTFGRRKFINNI